MACLVPLKLYLPVKQVISWKLCVSRAVVTDSWVTSFHLFAKISLLKAAYFSAVCSGFPRLYGVATASETYEGENTVLWLQVAR